MLTFLFCKLFWISVVACSDAVQNCAAYGKTVCSDPQYDQWVTKNCANYCNKCEYIWFREICMHAEKYII